MECNGSYMYVEYDVNVVSDNKTTKIRSRITTDKHTAEGSNQTAVILFT